MQVNLFDIVSGQELEKIEDPYILLRTIKESNCSRCTRNKFREENPGQQITIYKGNPRASIWVIGKSPGVQDGLEGVPFSYGSGDLLEKWLSHCGLIIETPDKPGNVFLTNTVFCSEKQDKTPTVKEMEACSFYINLLIKKLNPKVLLCLGSSAWHLVTSHSSSMKDIAGMTEPVLSKFNIPAWAIYHPAFFFKGSPDTEAAKTKTFTTIEAFKKYVESNNLI